MVLVFSLNTYNIYFFYAEKNEKKILLNECLAKILNLQMALDSIDVYQ